MIGKSPSLNISHVKSADVKAIEPYNTITNFEKIQKKYKSYFLKGNLENWELFIKHYLLAIQVKLPKTYWSKAKFV